MTSGDRFILYVVLFLIIVYLFRKARKAINDARERERDRINRVKGYHDYYDYYSKDPPKKEEPNEYYDYYSKDPPKKEEPIKEDHPYNKSPHTNFPRESHQLQPTPQPKKTLSTLFKNQSLRLQKPDKSIIYETKLDNENWRKKSREIKERDGWRCCWCGSTQNLQTHHKYYDKYPNNRMAEPWDYPDEALITLCSDCHKKAHEKYKTRVYYRGYGIHYNN